MRRILKPLGRLFVFDLVRPRFERTLNIYATLSRASESGLLTDVKNSLRASFSAEEVEGSMAEHFGNSVHMVATRLFPLHWWFQSRPAQRRLDTVQEDYLAQRANELSRSNRANYAAFRMLFRLLGPHRELKGSEPC